MVVCVDLSAVPVSAKYGVPEIGYDKVVVPIVVSSIKKNFLIQFRPCLEAGRVILVLGLPRQEGYPGTCTFLLS